MSDTIHNTPLKQRILDVGRKQRWLAKELGITEHTMTSYVLGENQPLVETAQRLAELLDCSVDDIFPVKSEGQ